MTVSEIEESLKSLSLADKKELLRTLLLEIEGHPGTQRDIRTMLTLEALDDVNADRFVDHADVKAWADSLVSETQQLLQK